MQRILHALGKMDRAGAETMVMNIYRNIDSKQYQFDFVVFSSQEGDYDKEIHDLGGKIYKISKSNPITRMFVLRNLFNAHPEYKIFHCHTSFSNAFHLVAAYMAKVPYRLVHGHTTNDNSKSKLIRFIYHAFARKVIKEYATHFLACGEAAANFLFPNQNNLLIVPNSIDADYFASMGEEEKGYINKLYQIDNDCLKIIQVGRFEAVKNHSFSIRVAQELKRRGVYFKMFFIGQGRLQADVKKEVHESNLHNEIIFLGVRTDMPQLMAGADVMIMPSYYEGFPVVLVEAQAVGLPSLVSDTISNEVDLGLGLVDFESLLEDKSIWVEKLLSLKKRTRMPKQDRLNHLVQRGFDIHSNTESLLNLYNSLK
jgi:glycosyltransferase EpsF